MHSLAPGAPRPRDGQRVAAGRRRRCEAEGRRDLPRRRPHRHAGLRPRRLPRRPDRVRARLRHGEPGALRRQHAADGLRHRLGLQAVHRHGDPPARARGQALARRRHPQVGAGDPVVRQDGDAAPPAPPHRRPARLHRAHEPPGHGGGGPLPGVGRARDHGPAEGPEFRPRRGVPLLQHRLQPPRARRREGERAVAARLFRAEDLRASRHAPHAGQPTPTRGSSRTARPATRRRARATGSRCPTGSRRATDPS